MQFIRAIGVALALVSFPAALRPAQLPGLPHLKMSDFQPAIRKQVQKADTAAHNRPRSAEASGGLGMVLDAYHQYESAELCYQRAYGLDARAFQWAYYLGSVEVHQGKYVQAAVTLRGALRLRPDYLPARLKLAESLLAAGDLGGSSEIYEAILKDVSKPVDSRLRGNDRNGDELRGNDDGGGSLPRSGGIAASAEALYGLGRIQAVRGDSAAATESYRRACELYPAYGAVQYALALAYQKMGKSEEAEPHFRAYQENMTVTPPIDDPLIGAVQALNLGVDQHLRRSIELEKQGDLRGAIKEQELALEVDPRNVQANINLISLYARVGDPDAADKRYQESVRLNPNRADAYYNYGVFLFMQGKSEEAERAYRQALQINSNYAEAHNNLGFLLEKQGKTEEALAEYEAALKSQPNYHPAHYNIATILARQGKYGASIEHLLRTLEPEDESTPAYLYALAVAYEREGDTQSALKYAREARDKAAARHQAQLVERIDQDFPIVAPVRSPQ